MCCLTAESRLRPRQEGTNSVQGVPAAVPLTPQQSKVSALFAHVLCVFLSLRWMLVCVQVPL